MGNIERGRLNPPCTGSRMPDALAERPAALHAMRPPVKPSHSAALELLIRELQLVPVDADL